MDENETVLAGRYQLESIVGRSESGVVWQAHDEALMRRVAVKEIQVSADVPPSAKAAVRERLLTMASLSLQLRHPGIVPIYDMFYEGVRCYVVRALVEGSSLADELDSGGPLPPEQVAVIGIELIDLLAVAHRVGIVHGGIKPSNVLLATDGRVYVTDLGMTVNQTAAQQGSAGLGLEGAPGYQSPERLRGEMIGPPSDIWSLGATLYAALEAQPPFRESTTPGTIAAVLASDVPMPHVKGPLREALVGMLTKEPESRLRADRIRLLLMEATDRPRDISPEAGTATALVPASVMAPSFMWEAADQASPKAPRMRRALLTAVGVAAGVLAVAIIATQAISWNPFAGAQTDTDSPSVTDRARRPLPDPFQSRALYRFGRDLFQPGNCRRPAAGELTFFERIPDDEAVVCEAAGYQLRLFRKTDASGLRAERRLYTRAAVDGSVQRINAAPTGPAGLFDGRRFVFVHPSDNQARIYWDSIRCACGGVIAGSDEAATIIGVWLDG